MKGLGTEPQRDQGGHTETVEELGLQAQRQEEMDPTGHESGPDGGDGSSHGHDIAPDGGQSQEAPGQPQGTGQEMEKQVDQ